MIVLNLIVQLGSLHSLQLVFWPVICLSQSHSNHLLKLNLGTLTLFYEIKSWPKTKNKQTINLIMSLQLLADLVKASEQASPIPSFTFCLCFAITSPQNPACCSTCLPCPLPLQTPIDPARPSLDVYLSFVKSPLIPPAWCITWSSE